MENDPLLEGLDVYIVGGAVRDALLGFEPGDRDWVVVGSTPEQLLDRGFIPIGADFPVFLHPQTKEEFALARTERKTGRGYKGFTFYTGHDVSLLDDLNRRDLTINAMARKPDGVLIDPLGGSQDIAEHRLQHVGPAFEEDPVRILRLARFAARFTDFSVAPSTVALCRRMVAIGEVDALVAERVWQELARALMSEQPSRFFDVLIECEALPVVLPGFVWTRQLAQQLDAMANTESATLPAMFATAMFESPAREALAKQLRAPTDCAQWAKLLPVVYSHCQRDPALKTAEAAAEIWQLITVADGVRRPERLHALVSTACGLLDAPSDELCELLTAGVSVKAGEIAKPLQAAGAQVISQAVSEARRGAIEARLKALRGDGDDPNV
jgi:tRNA nucleotidyltransferase (CCA-adding enzyme)